MLRWRRELLHLDSRGIAQSGWVFAKRCSRVRHDCQLAIQVWQARSIMAERQSFARSNLVVILECRLQRRAYRLFVPRQVLQERCALDGRGEVYALIVHDHRHSCIWPRGGPASCRNSAAEYVCFPCPACQVDRRSEAEVAPHASYRRWHAVAGETSFVLRL